MPGNTYRTADETDGHAYPAGRALDDDGRKHLEMIQAVISRMAANSFILKGWSVSAATALLALAAGTKHHWVALVALLPTIVFGALDGYYVAQERRFRALFCDVARVQPPKGSLSEKPPARYSMDVRNFAHVFPWGAAVWSKSVWPVHGITALAVAIVACVVSSSPDEPKDPVRVEVRDTVLMRTVPNIPTGADGKLQPDAPRRPNSGRQ